MPESGELPKRSEIIETVASKYAELYPWMDEDDAAITYWLLEIQKSLFSVAERAFDSVGQEKTRARYAVLKFLTFAEAGRLTHNQLVELLRIPPSTVSFLVDALEREGFLERRPHHNRRAAWIQLTAKGESVAAEMIRVIAMSMHETAVASFDPAVKHSFRQSLERFYQACEDWVPDEAVREEEATLQQEQ